MPAGAASAPAPDARLLPSLAGPAAAAAVLAAGWVTRWATVPGNDQRAVGILAALAALAVIWVRWPRDAGVDASNGAQGPVRTSLVLCALGLGAIAAGRLLTADIAISAGFVLLCVAILAVGLPGRALARLSPGFVLLLLSFPMPGRIEAALVAWLREANARVMELAARAADLDPVREAAAIAIDGRVLFVDDGCAGLNLIWPLLIGGVCAAGLTRASMAAVTTTLVAAPVLGVLLNMMRLAAVTLAYSFAGEDAGAWLHDVSGAAMVGLAFLVPLALLRLVDGALVWQGAGMPVLMEPDARRATPVPALAGLLVAVSLLIGSLAVTARDDSRMTGLAADWPWQVGTWVGEPSPLGAREREILDAVVVEQRLYHDLATGRAALVVASLHMEAADLADHYIEKCYGAKGFSGFTATERRVAAGLVMRRVTMHRGAESQMVHELTFTPGVAGARLARVHIVTAGTDDDLAAADLALLARTIGFSGGAPS